MLEKLLIDSIIFILPAFVANAAPTILGKGNRFNRPIDFGFYWIDNRRILGDGKTIRGFILGVLSGMICSCLILLINQELGISVNYVSYIKNSVLWIALPELVTVLQNEYISLGLFSGFLLGFGSLIGDLLGSFIKRRFSLQRGESFPFMDQVGFLITASIFVYILIPFPIVWMLFLIPITVFLHIFFNLVSFKIGLQKVRF